MKTHIQQSKQENKTATVITWDWKDQIDFEELNRILSKYNVSVIEVPDTGGDLYAVVVVGESSITKEEAQKFYDNRY